MDVLGIEALGDPGFEFCLRVMDRIYKFSPCLPDFMTMPYNPPELPLYCCHRGRNLWIDAFGVINFIALYKHDNNRFYLVCAAALVDAVHDTLGRSRDGTSRLPGATDQNPMKGGLRAGEMFEVDIFGDASDCQDFLSLAMWMFALNHLSLCSGMARYSEYAVQLAVAIYPRFSLYGDNTGRLPQKLSIDLKPIHQTTNHTMSHLMTCLAVAIIRDVQATALCFPHLDIPLVGEMRRCRTSLANVFRQCPTLTHCPDVYLVTNDPRVFMPHEQVRDLALRLFIGHHACDEPWGAEMVARAREASYHFFSILQGNVQFQEFRRAREQMELFLVAAAKYQPPLPRRRRDIDNMLIFWHDRVKVVSAEPSGGESDPAEMYMLYVAAQMDASMFT
ncbi:hypothetical protein F5X99DRAFT_164480 [Biscogniauxia marginata]|nr:hypothetical protein F5X99DRAFT_164480 [Biscogniauxia marginata]